MSGATAKGKKQVNKNAYRRAKKKQQRSVSRVDSLRMSH
jgi:splicing factor 3B subunit 2